MSTTIFYGEIKCSGILKNKNECKNFAYYKQNNKFLCGVHSKKADREKLPKNPNKNKILLEKYKKHLKEVEKNATENRQNNRKGNIILTKMKMMKSPPLINSYLNIFPNYSHQNRKDGFGCAELSPKSMGPIDTKQPKLPIAKNLENMHQFGKVFPSELDENKNIRKEFYITQKNGYLDPIPHRHKLTSNGENVPLFSIWIDKNGKENRISYFESRQFYCNFYERIALNTESFKYLKNKLDNGYNLNICGYDSYQPEKTIEECYKDITKPFGHELVLYTLLTYNENEYPWRKYKTFDF